MKLIMSAVTPLSLDEIRVALCVVLGEPVWHPEKMAKDGSQLITLCGGNLLDLDEEDGKVRFIHHSVIQHLLSPAASRSTWPYHFTVENAENLIGATCVTYLHLSVLDSRITVTRNLQSRGMLDTVIRTTQDSLPGVNRLVQHIKSREHKRARPHQFDIGQVLSQIQAARMQQDIDPRCFAPYATSHWVFHTRFFDENKQYCKESWRLWWKLLNGGVATVKSPFTDLEGNPRSALLWAVDHAHGSLFRNVLARCDLPPRQVPEVVHALGLHKSIRGHWLGDLLACYLLSLHIAEIPSKCDTVTLLLNLGANPVALDSRSQSSPIEILTNRICISAFSAKDERRLIHEIFFHPSVQEALADETVLNTLERLLESDKIVSIDEILARRPDLKLGFERIRDKRLSQRSLIEKALDNEMWGEVETLATQGLVNTPTLAGTSLLWKAIESKSDSWVDHILRLGADPNIGPFKMRHYINSPRFGATCYPLEAALWLRRTRVCLELLRHGADIYRLGGLPIHIAQETGNWVISARLQEILPGWLEPQKQSGHPRNYENGRTALATACKMLSESRRGDLPGFPRPLQDFENTGDWILELDKVIYRLALDEDAEYVNAQDTEGTTALHYLLERKDTDPDRTRILINVLLSRGADPNMPDNGGDTPLWLAIRNAASVDSVVQPLLEAGADPNRARIVDGASLLREAMMRYSDAPRPYVLRLVTLLLQAGADPRDPRHREIPDSTLESLAGERGMEYLVQDFTRYTHILNGTGRGALRQGSPSKSTE